MTTSLHPQRPQHRSDGMTCPDGLASDSALPPQNDAYLNGEPAAALGRKPIDSMTGDCQHGTFEQAVLPASTGNEDPGSEIELLGLDPTNIGHQRAQP